MNGVELKEVLQQYFGFTSFRPAQEPIIRSLLAGRDTLAVLPTGGGKSLCYQLPALCRRGLTVVISPLIALMKDQVDTLTEQNIPATMLNSAVTDEDFRARMGALRQGRYRLLYLAPERLESESFLRFLAALPIAMLVVDEAHCISEWGHEFRPSYRTIWRAVEALPRRPVIGAFTATATPHVRDDIQRELHLHDPAVFVEGFDRPNLYFDVAEGVADAYIEDYVRTHDGDSGIIYCATRKRVDELYLTLAAAGISVAKYHAGMGEDARNRAQDDFVYDRCPVIVATNAFGMGIDKSNVRYVLHAQLPASMEAYYQEAGRAGRDGEPSECILCYHGRDVRTRKYIIDHNPSDPEALRRLYEVVDYCKSDGCLRARLLGHFGATVPARCEHCGNCERPHAVQDVTADALDVLRAVRGTRERYGMAGISRLLRGRLTERDLRAGLDHVAGYGTRSGMTEQTVRAEIDRYIEAGVLYRHGDKYPLLGLTAHGDAVLSDRRRVTITVRAPRRSAPPPARLPAGPARAPLFAALRAKRKVLAAEKHVPPYVIFSDATLAEMAAVKPRTLEAFGRIKGVGDFKKTAYGPAFIQVIQEMEDA